MKKYSRLFFLILFPLIGYSQTRVILSPDRGFKSIPAKARSMAFDTLNNEITLTRPGTGTALIVDRIPNLTTLGSYFSPGAGIGYNSITRVFSLTATSDQVTEGTTNKFFSNALARAALSAGTGIGYNTSTGAISLNATTDQVMEGTTNKFFSNSLARNAISVADSKLTYNATTGVFGFGTVSTDALTEGAQLFFTNARARLAFSGSGAVSYNNSTGAIALNSSAQLPGTPTVQTNPASNATGNEIVTAAWINAKNFGVAGSSPNTAQNIGTAGVGLFKDIDVANIRFKKLNVTSNLLTLTDDTANDEVDITLNQGNLSIAGSQITGNIATAQTPAYTGDVTKPLSSGVTTIANNAVTLAKMATLGAKTYMGRTTNSTGNVEAVTAAQLKADLSLDQVPNADATNATNIGSGTLNILRTPAYSGDVAKSAGAGTLTIGANVVTNAKMAQMANGTLKGRSTAGTGDSEDLTPTQVKTLLLLNNVPNTDATNASNIGSGTLSALRLPAVTGGDIAGSAGSVVYSINSNAVTNAKMATMATKTYKGRTSAGTGNAEDVTAAQLKTDLAVDQVNNTSDAAKPVSTAQQTALDLKPTTSGVTSFRSTSTPAYNSVNITDANIGGLFVKDVTDTTTPDNTGTTIVDASGVRWKRQYESKLDVKAFGVVYGTGLASTQRTANTVALNNAYNSGVPLVQSNLDIEINGAITITNKNLSVEGAGRFARIDQYADVTTINFSTSTTLKNSCVIQNLKIVPMLTMSSGVTGIRISSGGGNVPSAIIRDVDVSGDASTSNRFDIGLYITNPAESTVENYRFYAQNKDAASGIKIDNNVLSISSTFRNCKIYGAQYGIYCNSTGNPGIEGTRVIGSDFVSCDYGIYATSDGVYGTYQPVQFDVLDCHFNCFTAGVYMNKYAQVMVRNNLVYLYNTPSSGVGVNINETGDLSIINNKIFNIGGGPSYGITTNGTCNRVRIVDNTGNLRSANTEAFIIIGSGTINYQVDNNSTTNGQVCVADNAGTETPWNNKKDNVLEEYSPRFAPQTIQQGNVSVTTYWKLGDFPLAYNNGGNIDMARFLMHVGTWNANSRQDVDVSFSTRDNFLYLYDRRGVQQSTSGLVVYRNADNTTSVYAVLGGAYQRATISWLQAWGMSNYPARMGTGTTTAPTGSVIFDSRAPITYPPQNRELHRTITAIQSSVNPTYTLDPSLYSGLTVYNTTGVTSAATLDVSKARDGDVVTITLLPGSNAGLTVSTSSGNIQTGNSLNTTTTFSTAGIVGATFKFRQGNWERIGEVNTASGGSTTDASLLTTGTLNAARLPSTAVTAGSYTYGSFMVDATGRLTAASSGAAPLLASAAGAANGIATLDANTKIPFAQLPGGQTNTQSGTTYTLVATDCNKKIYFTSSSAVTVTIPASIVTAGCSVNWVQKGTGQVSFAAGSGLTLTSYSSYLKSAGQYAMGTVDFESTTAATLGGTISN